LALIGWQAAGDKTTIVKAFSKFSPGVQQVIASADKDLKVWDLYDMESLPTWTRGRAALLGDAAHPFQPCKELNSFNPTN
jgi:salicylate hydroxylase